MNSVTVSPGIDNKQKINPHIRCEWVFKGVVMETKSVYNRHVIRSILIGLLAFLFIYMTYAFEIAETYFTVFLAVLGLILTVLPIFFYPYKFVFSSEGVTFKYLFSKNNIYLWDKVSDIHIVYERVFGDSYEIWEEKPYNRSRIPKSRKTKRLIEEYYKPIK